MKLAWPIDNNSSKQIDSERYDTLMESCLVSHT